MEEFEFIPKQGAMDNVPETIREDLLERMRSLLQGIAGDVEKSQYSQLRHFQAKPLKLSAAKSASLYRYSIRSYYEIEKIVLECANGDPSAWMSLAKKLYNTELYFRRLLNEKQLATYEKSVVPADTIATYMSGRILMAYRKALLKKG